MLPVISAAAEVKDAEKMPQQIYIGTPPAPSCKGTVFKEMHNISHSAEKGDTWWLEWSIESDNVVSDISTADKALEMAYTTNPAMGYRIAERTIRNEYDNMSIDGFARERLGWWSPVLEHKEDYAIPVDIWDACKSDEPKPEGKTAYGVKFTPDGAEVSLCGAVLPKDGAARISLIERRPTGAGTQWLADWLNERYNKASCVVIDGRNGVDVLIDKISGTWRMKGSIIRPTVRDVIASVSTLTDALNEQTVTWYSGQEMLRESAVTSTKRPIAGGWGFGGENSSPIEACALALYGVKTTKRDPDRKMRIG